MLSVRLPLADMQARMPADVYLAAENGPQACVVAGAAAAIDAWASALEADGVGARRLVTSHAFHSPMMDAAVAPFEALVREVALAPPRVPIVSPPTRAWLTDAQAVDPAYWARQLREPVRFSRALRTALLRHPRPLTIEMGPARFAVDAGAPARRRRARRRRVAGRCAGARDRARGPRRRPVVDA